jgi:hypothetical protein
MDRHTINPTAGSPRRFLLLAEQGDDVAGRGPRIRRYRLASVSPRSGGGGPDTVTARLAARDAGPLGERG